MTVKLVKCQLRMRPTAFVMTGVSLVVVAISTPTANARFARIAQSNKPIEHNLQIFQPIASTLQRNLSPPSLCVKLFFLFSFRLFSLSFSPFCGMFKSAEQFQAKLLCCRLAAYWAFSHFSTQEYFLLCRND
mgnify:CR=1 FL=1